MSCQNIQLTSVTKENVQNPIYVDRKRLPKAAVFGHLHRAKFITGSVAQLLGKPGGGAAWLQGLREAPYPEAVQALCTLPGIGPKVGAKLA